MALGGECGDAVMAGGVARPSRDTALFQRHGGAAAQRGASELSGGSGPSARRSHRGSAASFAAYFAAACRPSAPPGRRPAARPRDGPAGGHALHDRRHQLVLTVRGPRAAGGQ